MLTAPPIHPTRKLAARMSRVTGSAIREILKLLADPTLISLAGGIPAPELFPTKALAEAYSTVLHNQPGTALQYSATEGVMPLREKIAEMMQDQGVPCGAEHVLITSGSQQGMDLLARVLLDPGSPCVLAEPAYVGAIQAFNAVEASYRTVPADNHGLQTDALPGALAGQSARLIYSVPNFDNPSGTTLPLDRREALLAAAHRYNVTVIEDDPYQALRYEGNPVTGLLALDSAAHGLENSRVIYLGSFSKVLAPGLRIGWAVAPTDLLQKLVLVKQGADLHTTTINQYVVLHLLNSGMLPAHLETLRTTYKHRRDVMLDALAEFFPRQVQWTKPEGGMFVWVTMPEGIDGSAVLKAALVEKVAFVPGSAFFAVSPGERHFRLSFSNPSPENIREGVRRLGRVLARFVN